MSTVMDELVLSAHAEGWLHMGGWGWGMAIFGLVFMVLIVVFVAWLIWLATRRSGSFRDGGRDAVDLLDERYARGEIDRDEYLQRKGDLEK